MSYEQLLKKIQNFQANICVVGLGQVGLPTALTFSKHGFNVIGYDINEQILTTLNNKKSPFEEKGLEELIINCIENKKFQTSMELFTAVQNSDIVIVCVATPITENIQPNLSHLKIACESLSKLDLSNKLIVIESSIPPGTFQNLVLPILTTSNTLGSDFWATYIPERLSPGEALTEISSTPRIIGYEDIDSSILSKNLYAKIVDSSIFVTKSKTAELSKLVENSFRDVNIAFANEISLICEKYGIDVMELLQVCNSHPRVNVLTPGPGVGGPCLPKDPYLLLNPQNMTPLSSKIISNSREINDFMPHHVVELTISSLEKQKKNLKNSKILILGISYKANVSDTRMSPSKQIISELQQLGSKVLVHDSFTTENFNAERMDDLWSGISISDVIILVTDHDEYKKLDLSSIASKMQQPPILIDTRRIFDKDESKKLGINYYGIGFKPI